MWIAKMCEVYGMIGSLVGCTSIWTMTYIAFDRYNVIVKGLSAKPMTNGGAVLRIAFIWAHALIWTLAPMFGWNRYVPEGNMTACGTDYLTKDWFSRSYILVYSFFVYFLPLFMIIYSYWFIVKVIHLFNCSANACPNNCLVWLISFFDRLSLLTRKICVNKRKKWMLPHCVHRRLKILALNANWPKLHWWPFHFGSWPGPHIWLSISQVFSKQDKFHHWQLSGVHCLLKQMLFTIQSSTVSAIRNIVQHYSRNSHHWPVEIRDRHMVELMLIRRFLARQQFQMKNQNLHKCINFWRCGILWWKDFCV